jgi:hypothetical protein
VLIGCGLIATMCAMAQPGLQVLRMSDIFAKKHMVLKDPGLLQPPAMSLRDTVHVEFQLINDLGQDTSLYLYEAMSDWIRVTVKEVSDSSSTYVSISGRDYFDKIPYDYVYFASRPILFRHSATYNCKFDYVSPAYRAGRAFLWLMTPNEYFEQRADQKEYEYINNLVTYFFTGALAFGFFFFLFLYIKSRYPVFGFYALFLFMQFLYGFIQFDVYTSLGHFFLTRFNWDDYVSDVIVFVGQAAYVRFLALWLELKTNHRKIYRFFNVLSIFFLVYAFTLWTFYMIDRNAMIINVLFSGIRVAAV